MSMLRFVSNFLAFRDSKVTNDPKDKTQIELTVEETSYKSMLRHDIQVADGVTNQSVPMPEAASEYLLFYTDQTVTVKLDGSATAMTLKPRTAGTKTLALMTRGSVTSMTVSNGSGATAKLDIIAVKL